jgi:hypothetical protein
LLCVPGVTEAAVWIAAIRRNHALPAPRKLCRGLTSGAATGGGGISQQANWSDPITTYEDSVIILDRDAWPPAQATFCRERD